MSLAPDSEEKIKLGITVGDINGIGLEIILKAFSDIRMLQVCSPIIYGSSKAISYHRKLLNIAEFNYNTVRHFSEFTHKRVNLVNCWEEEIKFDIGKSTEAGGKYAFFQSART